MNRLPAPLRRLEWIGTAVVLALVAWYWLRYFNRNTNLLDEGSTAAQAMRILRGDLIYRDFFTVVTPLSYYTVAWLFRLFGEYLMVLRWAALVTGVGIAFVSLLIARRIASWPYAAGAALLTTVWGWFLVTPNFYSWEAALFSLAALACYMRSTTASDLTGRRRWLVAAGIATGLAAMTKQNIGAYTAAGLLFAVWASRAFDHEWNVRERFAASLRLIAGICVAVIPTLVWLIAAGAGPFLYESWVYYPLAKYPERFSRPFPDFFPIAENDPFDLWTKLVIYLPVLVYPVALIMIVLLARRSKADRAAQQEGHALLAVWGVGLLTLLQAFPRADVPHILFGLQPTYILFAYLSYCVSRSAIRVTRSGTALAVATVIITLLPIAILLRQGRERTNWEYQNYIAPLRTERGRGIIAAGLEAQRIDIVSGYIAGHTAPDDGVFVVPWASGFNFLTNRMNPTRSDFLLFEDPEAYPCLLSRLDERPPKYVIYGYTWDVDDKHFRDYAAPVDRYIRSRYEIEFATDGYEIWRRIDDRAAAGTFPQACQPRRFRLADLGR